jgi:hypothetical protein
VYTLFGGDTAIVQLEARTRREEHLTSHLGLRFDP